MQYSWKATKKKEEPIQQPQPQEQQIILLGADQGSPQMGMGLDGFEVEDDTIYFYGGIEDQRILQLNKAITGLDFQARAHQLRYPSQSELTPIHLKIKSNGGEIFAGFSGYDTICRSKTPVHTYVDGQVASAATFLLIAGKKRFMSPHGFVLLHELRGDFWGKYAEMQDQMQNVDLMMKHMIDMYEKHCKIPKSLLKDLLKKDLWLDAKQCLEYGIVDELI